MLFLLLWHGVSLADDTPNQLEKKLYQESVLKSSSKNPVPFLNSLSFFIEANQQSDVLSDQSNVVRNYLRIKSVDKSIEQLRSLHPKIGLGIKAGKNINLSFGFDTSEITKKLMLLGSEVSNVDVNDAILNNSDLIYNFAGIMYDSYQNTENLKRFHSLHQIYISTGGEVPNPKSSPVEYANLDIGPFWRMFINYNDIDSEETWDSLEDKLRNTLTAQLDTKIIQNLNLCKIADTPSDCAKELQNSTEIANRFNEYYFKKLAKEELEKPAPSPAFVNIEEINSFFSASSRLAKTLNMDSETKFLTTAGLFTESISQLNKANSAFELGQFLNASTFSMNSLTALFAIGSVLETKKSADVSEVIYLQNIEILKKLNILDEKVNEMLVSLSRIEDRADENFNTLLNTVQTNTELLDILNSRTSKQYISLGHKISDLEYGRIQTSLKILDKISLTYQRNIETRSSSFGWLFGRSKRNALPEGSNNQIIANMGEIEGLLLRLQKSDAETPNKLTYHVNENVKLIELISKQSYSSSPEFVPYFDQVTFIQVLEEYLETMLKLPPEYLKLIDVEGIEGHSIRYKNQIKEIQNLAYLADPVIYELASRLKNHTDAQALEIINDHRGQFKETLNGELTDVTILELLKNGFLSGNNITEFYSKCLVASDPDENCNHFYKSQMPSEIGEHSFLKSFGIVGEHKEKAKDRWFWDQIVSDDPNIHRRGYMCVPYRYFSSWGPSAKTKYSNLIDSNAFTWDHYTTCAPRSGTTASLWRTYSRSTNVTHANNALTAFLYNVVDLDEMANQAHGTKRNDRLKVNSREAAKSILNKMSDDIQNAVKNELWRHNKLSSNQETSTISSIWRLLESQKYSMQFTCPIHAKAKKSSLTNMVVLEQLLNNLRDKDSSIMFMQQLENFIKSKHTVEGVVGHYKIADKPLICDKYGKDIDSIDIISKFLNDNF